MQHFVTMVTFERCFSRIFLRNLSFFLGCCRKCHGSVLFLLEVFSLKNEGAMAIFPKITFMTSHDRKCVGGPWKWRHAVCTLLVIILVFT